MASTKSAGPSWPGKASDAVVGDPAFFREAFNADKEWIAGEGGESGVGRAAEASGTEREYLPEALFCGTEKVDKGVRGRAEVADATVGRE